MKQSVTVKLAGQTLNLKTEDEGKHVRLLVKHLEERIDEIRRGAGAASSHQIALLAGLRVVDELFTAQRALDEVRGTVKDRVEHVLSLLDEHGLN